MTMIKKNQEVHFSAHVWTRSQTIKHLTWQIQKLTAQSTGKDQSLPVGEKPS